MSGLPEHRKGEPHSPSQLYRALSKPGWSDYPRIIAAVKTGARVDLLNRLVTDRLAVVLALDGDALERREMTPLSPAQARTFLRAATDPENRYSAIYVVAVTAGLRQGELLDLTWEDIDLEGDTLRVRRTLQPAGFPKGAPARLTPPKTKKSVRTVRLPRRAVEALLSHAELQEAERAASSGSWRDRGFVFPNTGGGPTDYTNLVPRHFKPLLKRAGGPNIRFHDLRHTCATLLLAKGVHPKIVSEMLGHSSVSIALDNYSHVIPGLGDAAAGAMDEVLS